MADATGHNRDGAEARRRDIADRFETLGRMIRHADQLDLGGVAIQSLLESALDHYERLRSDDLDLSLHAHVEDDYAADVEMHICIDAEAYCYICDQETVARIEEQRRWEMGE